MKNLVIVFVSLVSMAANAGLPNPEGEPNNATGLGCSLEYKQSGVLETAGAREQVWISDGGSWDSLNLNVVSQDSSGNPQSGIAANTVQATVVEKNGKEYWSVLVLDAVQAEIGSLGFPYEAGGSATFPVNAIDNEVEDPSSLDSLTVTCKLVPFAG